MVRGYKRRRPRGGKRGSKQEGDLVSGVWFDEDMFGGTLALTQRVDGYIMLPPLSTSRSADP
eukprot:1892486-Pyramimonas_sp.AAC.1